MTGKVDGLTSIQALLRQHPQSLKAILYKVCVTVIQVKNLCSCAAMASLGVIYAHLQKAMDDMTEEPWWLRCPSPTVSSSSRPVWPKTPWCRTELWSCDENPAEFRAEPATIVLQWEWVLLSTWTIWSTFSEPHRPLQERRPSPYTSLLRSAKYVWMLLLMWDTMDITHCKMYHHSTYPKQWKEMSQNKTDICWKDS